MAAARSAALFVVLSGFAAVASIKDGSTISQCDYPGVVAFIFQSNNVIICNGVRSGGAVYVSQLCGSAIEDALTKNTVLMAYGDGTKRVTVPVNSIGTLANGVYKMSIAEPIVTDCNSEATLYETGTTIDTSSCEIVGYGGDSLTAKVYDGVLRSASLTKSTSAPCCRVIFDSLTETEKGTLVDPNVPLNCVVSSGAACGTGDLGGPVYCKKTDGSRIVVGLVASSPCESNGRFLIHDLTGSAEVKFGIST